MAISSIIQGRISLFSVAVTKYPRRNSYKEERFVEVTVLIAEKLRLLMGLCLCSSR